MKTLQQHDNNAVATKCNFEFAEFGINSNDELKELSDARMVELREELAKTDVEQKRKKILKLLEVDITVKKSIRKKLIF